MDINISQIYFVFRLIKEYDREIKDEEGRNSPEVNKQLNDEKQSMVSSFKHIQYASCLIDTKKLLGIIVRALQGIKIWLVRGII